MYIYIYYTPPPRYPGLGLVQMCFDRGSRQDEAAQICTLGDQRKEVCLIEERRLGRDPCPFSMALPHTIQFTYLPTQTMPSFKALPQITHISSHKPCLVSFKDSSTENSHILSPNTCLFTCLLSMKQRQHM